MPILPDTESTDPSGEPKTAVICDARVSDFARILELNEESVHFLSPLTAARLDSLHAEAAYHRVVRKAGRVATFLLAFREGAGYDSVNYRWFASHYHRFLYIDRVVVSQESQGQGLGTLLYADLFDFAKRSKAGRVTCEIDIDPPNEPSQKFHQRYGFAEVGSQRVASGEKRVSLQAVLLPADAGRAGADAHLRPKTA